MDEDNNSSDEEFNSNDLSVSETNEDILMFETNYQAMKKQYIRKPYLTKFEKTKVISERSQQLSNGAISFQKNSNDYDNVYEIAFEELKQKKLPFIIIRPVANGFEYWKLEDFRF